MKSQIILETLRDEEEEGGEEACVCIEEFSVQCWLFFPRCQNKNISSNSTESGEYLTTFRALR